MKMKNAKQTTNTKKTKTLTGSRAVIKPAVKKQTVRAKTVKADFKPYSTVNEMLAEVFNFYTEFNVLKGIQEKEDYFKEVKGRLAATAVKTDQPLLRILTKNPWNNSEYIGLLFSVGLYITERRALYLDTLFKLANENILDSQEIISVFTERKSKLFSEGYFECNVFTKGGFAISNKITGLINGSRTAPEREIPKAVAVKKALNPALKSVDSICRELSRYVVGQDKAKKVLATALFEHILRIRLKEKGSKNKFDKKNVLLLGPTGCGKTYLCQTLAKIADIPFIMGDSTQYSATGYHGGDVQELIINLAQATNTKDGGTIPLSIVFIDEFDKLKFSKDGNGFDMTRKVQDNLLKMLESEKFYLFSKPSFMPRANYYDISKVLFVASGAFSDLEEKANETKTIGFTPADSAQNKDVDVAKITKYGFLPEILGRLTYRVFVDKLTREQLTDILTKAENNPIQQYAELYKECGKELVVPTEKISDIVKRALTDGTGARGLNSILGEYLREELSTMELPDDAFASN